MYPNPPKSFLKKVLSSSFIVLTPHISPDGDAVGSCTALYFILQQKGISSAVVTEYKDTYLNILKKINNTGCKCNIDIYENFSEIPQESLGKFPLHCYVDCAEKKRIGEVYKQIENLPHTAIDHHQRGETFETSYVFSSSNSTANLVYRIAKELNVNLTKEISGCLFYAISSDTGSFKHIKQGEAESFSDASELVKNGAAPDLTYQNMYSGKNINFVKYMSVLLSNVQYHCNNRIAFIIDNKECYDTYGEKSRPSDVMYSTLMMVEGIEAVVFLKYTENDKLIEGSIRISPKSEIDASLIAQKVGNGGGHIKAAGFRIEKSISNLIKEICLLI